MVAVAESARPPGRAPVDAVRLFRSSPRLALDGLRYLAGLRAAGVPVLYRRVLKAVQTADGGLAATLVRVGEEEGPADRTMEVDAVCVGYGFQPNNEVLRCLGCRHDHDERRGHLVTVRNEHCETTVPGIYAIGDCCGLGGAPAALDEGVIAACAAVRSLGFELDARAGPGTRASRSNPAPAPDLPGGAVASLRRAALPDGTGNARHAEFAVARGFG